MVKKTTVEEQVAATAKSEKSGRGNGGERKAGGILRYTLITVVASIIAISLCAVVLKEKLLDAGSRTYAAQLSTTYAHQYAGFFNQIFNQASRQLSNIASSSHVVNAVASGDPATLAQMSETIAASLAGKSQVFLVPNSMSLSDITLGFAAQNMTDRARHGEEIKAEVIPLKDRPLLLLAYAIRDSSKQIIGVLLVGFDLNEISANLKVFDVNSGYMSLIQNLEGNNEPRPVLSYGLSQYADAPFAASSETVHPNLSVSFHLNPDQVHSNSGGLFLIAMAAMMVLVTIAIIGSSLLLQRALKRNASILLQYAESLVRRAPSPAGIHFDIDVFEEVAQSLGRASPGPSSTSATALAPAPARRNSSRASDIEVEVSTGDAQFLQEGNVAADSVPAEIFRAYDIRGVVGKTLNEETVKLIGQAIGSEALEKGQKAIYVGRDGRLSGPQLVEALVQGLVSTGCRVVNLGMVPTPLVYFACANTAVKSGVVLTGSHNPADHNGLKIVIDGETLADKRIQELRERILAKRFVAGKGSAETLDIAPKYLERVKDDVVLARPMKVVVDCGNGVAGAMAPQVMTGIGCSVVPLYCDIDGNFPNHHPDPSKPDNLRDLIAKVIEEKADIGLAFDGDGDRIGVVTPQGKIIWPDRLMMLFARDLLMRSPGADIIFDVKCTRDLANVISQHGGRPLMWRTGHSLIKAKLKETGAALAGEMSGHIFFNDRWFGFDDAMYSAARLLEILSLEVASADDVFAEFPANVSTPELHINVAEDQKFRIVEQLQKQGDFSGGSVSTIDGVRVDYPNAWGLVRASNTTATLVCRFEGKTEEDLATVRNVFRDQLQKVDSAIRIPF